MRIFKKPDTTPPVVSRWHKHVAQVGQEIRVGLETPPWWKRLEDYFGFHPFAELRSLGRWLVDADPMPVYVVVKLDEVERALSELEIARTALTYRWHEPEQRESALARLVVAEARVRGAMR